MGMLYLVRHGQASFGAADYDQLSSRGAEQCTALGRWLHARGIVFDGVLRGTLKRHVQSLDAIARGVADAGGHALPAALEWPGLNEYDGHAIVRAIRPAPLPAARSADPTDATDSADAYRAHFRLLRQGLQAWMAGRTQPAGMPSYAGFVDGVTSALDFVRSNFHGNVLLVSSGGPISTAVGHVLGTTAETTIELNLRIRNSALSEFAFTPKRHMLVSYNHLPHLDHPDRRGWETYA